MPVFYSFIICQQVAYGSGFNREISFNQNAAVKLDETICWVKECL